MSERKHIHGVRPYWKRIWEDISGLVSIGTFILAGSLILGVLYGYEWCLWVLAGFGMISLLHIIYITDKDSMKEAAGREEWLIANGDE